MANLNVTYDDMNQAAIRLDAGKADLERILHDLKSVVDGLTASGFQTELASGAYLETYEKFTSGTIQAIGGLEGLSTYLRKAAEAMASTDAELAKAIKQ